MKWTALALLLCFIFLAPTSQLITAQVGPMLLAHTSASQFPEKLLANP